RKGYLSHDEELSELRRPSVLDARAPADPPEPGRVRDGALGLTRVRVVLRRRGVPRADRAARRRWCLSERCGPAGRLGPRRALARPAAAPPPVPTPGRGSAAQAAVSRTP